MYKKNKVNLTSLKGIMGRKMEQKKLDRKFYSENLMTSVTKKLDKRQKEIDKQKEIQKKYQKNSQKNILY